MLFRSIGNGNTCSKRTKEPESGCEWGKPGSESVAGGENQLVAKPVSAVALTDLEASE